ncbi:MAG: FHA domain-containing protein, partial [Planctomycetota bacterium]
MAHRPALNVVEGTDKGKVFHLDGKDAFTLGRGHGVDIPIMDIRCSREHCKVERRPDGYYLSDLGSSLGTRLNGKKLKRSTYQRLEPGDRIRLGHTTLTFVPGDAPAYRASTPAAAPPPGTGGFPSQGPGLEDPFALDFDFGAGNPFAEPAPRPPVPSS